MRPFSTASHLDIARRKQAARQQAIAASGLTDLPDDAEVYLRATASEIVQRISEGEWTATQVLEAYIARATLAQDRTNCLTEVLFSQAREEAEAVDDEFASTGKTRGPLHGVPVSFKDQIDIKGFDSTTGFSSYADKPRSQDAHLVALVREAGGIPIAKTNLSQMLFFFECSNPVWGRTINPYSKSHTSGGSSGGEGALLAMDGAALGWGTDIGGSLRIPASFCGIYSLKPGHGRISVNGLQESLPGFEGIRLVAGPMARSVKDLELASRLVFGKQDAENDPVPMPYRDVRLPEKLRFGYYLSDGYIKASPACQRAVLETIDALRRAGHECVEFDVPRASEALETFMSLTCSDGLKTLQADLGNDPVEAGITTILMGPSLNGWVRKTLSWTVRNVLRDEVLAGALLASRPCSLQDYYKLVRRRNDYIAMFYREVWNKYQFDGIIAPVIALPTLPHDACKYLATLAAGPLLYNFLDTPVGTLPVTHVRSTDVATAEWTDKRIGKGHGSHIIERLLYGVQSKVGYSKSGFYSAERMTGIPVGVQIVGKKWEEEKVVEMMKVVDDALGPRDFGPFSWREQKN